MKSWGKWPNHCKRMIAHNTIPFAKLQQLQIKTLKIKCMKTFRIFIFLSILLLLKTSAKSQETAYNGNVQHKIDLARELFNKGKYISSFREFEKIQKNLDAKSELYSEAEYYKSVAALKADYSAGGKMLTSFTENYSESPFINQAWYNLGDYQFERRQYTVAIRTFQNIDRSDLGKEELVKLKYMNGYSNLMDDNLEVASREFYDIKDANNIYSKPATYYWAHIMYLQENYQSALEGFTKLNNDPIYSRVIPLYISHIYYKQEKYNDVVNYTTSVIDDVGEDDRVELSKIVGDSYFHLNEFEKAIPYLETFFNATKLKTREDNYILGYCYYHSGQYDKAAPLLEGASQGNDAMAQNAYYHLADCYIKTNDKEKAKLAFDAASKLDFDEHIKGRCAFQLCQINLRIILLAIQRNDKSI